MEKGMSASILPSYLRMFDRLFQEMEATLADHPWLTGENFSLAECALLPYLWRLERLNLDGMWADKPNLARWFARGKERPSWNAAMEAYPPLDPPSFDDDLKSKGINYWPAVQKMLSE
jgi:glutathione S-transferase